MMIARTSMLALALTGPALGEPAVCGAPLSFNVTRDQLPATQAAITRKSLPVLVLGGAAATGDAAGGAEHGYPARIQARLRALLPGVEVTVTTRATARQRTAEVLKSLDNDLKTTRPALVVWGLGGSAAARGEDTDGFTDIVSDVITRSRSAGADIVLMTMQYPPALVHLVNFGPYRLATMHSGDVAGVPILDRYDMMRAWYNDGVLNLDATGKQERIMVARKLFDCVAEALTTGIGHALR